jgi:hypothetical protein
MAAKKGSQKWIQRLVNDHPDLLNSQIRTRLNLTEDEDINWISPKAEDDYAEYYDEAFLEKLEIKLEKYPLKDFWPRSGPRWDGLGKSSSGKIFLVEAKSHIPELISTLKATKEASKTKILSSLEETKKRFGVKSDYDWTKTFYQYANRLAHVYLLRKNNVPAFLVNIYFLNDLEMDGPQSADEWKGAIRLQHRCLGLRENLLEKLVVDIFVDVTVLNDNSTNG